jgi:hypothetical protein
MTQLRFDLDKGIIYEEEIESEEESEDESSKNQRKLNDS